jgi:hypothetical protein
MQMANTSHDKLGRLVIYGLNIAEDPAAPEGIKMAAPTFIEAVREFPRLNEAIREPRGRVKREREEAQASVSFFTALYETARAALQSNAPHELAGPAASRLATVADLLLAAQSLEGVLERYATEAWVKDFLPRYAEAIRAAEKEWKEHCEAANALQKLEHALEAAALKAEAALVPFRKMVKVVYGATSKEYHSLKLRRRGTDEVDDNATVPEPAPMAAKATGTDGK